jgi:ABC-type transporter Mla maintaining outer membrane lipid asymmetry ATPase subunit MlaF
VKKTDDNTTAGAPAIELVDVAVPSQERTRAILEGVQWRVRTGDFWAIGGLSRSGKTNLMLVAAGVLRPWRGTYRLFGKDLSGGFAHDDMAYRLKVGMVFDGGQLLQHLTLAENVGLPLRYHAQDDVTEEATAVRLAELLEFTGLSSRAGLRPAGVNRNWQQRFGLARALALRPEVLLLDSPLSGLDAREANWWLEILGALSAGHPIVGRPVTLAVTGDDLRPWRRRARQFAVLKDHALVDLGSASEMDINQDPFLRDLLPPALSGS